MRLIPLLASSLLLGTQVNALIPGGVATKFGTKAGSNVKRDADPEAEAFVVGYSNTGFAGPGGRIGAGFVRRDADPRAANPMIMGGGGGTGGFGGGRFGRRDAEAEASPMKTMIVGGGNTGGFGGQGGGFWRRDAEATEDLDKRDSNSQSSNKVKKSIKILPALKILPAPSTVKRDDADDVTDTDAQLISEAEDVSPETVTDIQENASIDQLETSAD